MEVKFNCSNPACRRRISVDESMMGKPFTCPACGTEEMVPTSASIRFTCSNPECGQHVAVDVSESGRFVKCPACEKVLRVPGALPQSLAPNVSTDEVKTKPKPRIRAIKQKPGEVSPVRNLISRALRLLVGWGIGAALVGLVMGGIHLRTQAVMPVNLDKMSDEIFASGRVWDAPLESNDGSKLIYAQDQGDGAGIFIVDLKTLRRTQVGKMTSQDIRGVRGFKLFGWSPEDRWLAFAFLVKDAELNQLVQKIVICEGTSGQVKSSYENKQACMVAGAWLTTNTLALVDEAHELKLWNLEADNAQRRFGSKGMNSWGKINNSGPVIWVETNLLGYIAGAGVNVYDVFTSRSSEVVRFAENKMEWLDYNPGNGKYLFCAATRNDDTNRFVFEFRPTGQTNAAPIQRSFSYSLKGQWISQGDDVAYVTTTGDKTVLAIDTQDASLKTNIFDGGSVRSYSVSPKRDKLYAVAAMVNRVQSIWEYDIVNKTFRDVLPVEQNNYLYSTAVAAVNVSATNQNNELIDYYYVPPANMNRRKKYPVILDLYPVNRYDQNAQMLVNAGIFYVAANRFGLNDWTAVAKPGDILAIYAQLLKNPNIDPKRIYVYGRSYSTTRVTEMVNEHPEVWRGAIFFSPVAFPKLQDSGVDPQRLFIAEGDEDEASLQTGCFKLWERASRLFITAQLHFEHAGHGFSTQNYKTAYEALIRFILEDN